MLCLACNTVSVNIYAFLENPSRELRSGSPFNYFHSQSLAALRQSTTAGCELCTLLLEHARTQINAEKLQRLQLHGEVISYQIRWCALKDNLDMLRLQGLNFYFGWDDNPYVITQFSAFFDVELIAPPCMS